MGDREEAIGRTFFSAARSVLMEVFAMVGKYCIVRTYSAGVFAGTIVRRKGQECLLRDARRLWHWRGAASLSQLAVDGTSLPAACKFPCEVPEVLLTQVIEIIPVMPKARQSIAQVPVWKQ